MQSRYFAKQIFGNQIFALFINTFLNGKNGISNNYLNSMQVSYSGSTVTINSGVVCIQGRFVEEDTNTPISAGTDNSYCKLVIEIDLDKENTESELNQVSYKIIKSTSSYPNLTQQDIVNNNSGIYQYELARFRTSASGITDFQDKRTFLDFSSIYNQIQTEYRAVLEQLQEELSNVKDGSDYLLKSAGGVVQGLITANGGITGNLKGNVTGNTSGSAGSCTGNSATATKLQTARNISLTGDVTGSASFDGSKNVSISAKLANIAVLTGTVNATAASGDTHSFNSVKINFPNGFNANNCIVLSWYIHRQGSSNNYGNAFGCTSVSDSRTWLRGGYPSMITFNFQNDNKITFTLENPITSATNFDYKIVLMKI